MELYVKGKTINLKPNKSKVKFSEAIRKNMVSRSHRSYDDQVELFCYKA